MEAESEVKVEATAKCWCSNTSDIFGIVVIGEGGTWSVQHSFLCSPHYVDPESEAIEMEGQIALDDNYNGCKHCNNETLVRCGTCNAYSCAKNGGISPIKTAKCGKCGTTGLRFGVATSISISGD